MSRAVPFAVLAALAGCSSESEPSCDPWTSHPSPTVDITAGRSGPRICDAVVVISGMGKRFDCTPAESCDAPYDCTGPTLGGNYAVRVTAAGFVDGLKVVKLDDACDPEQFDIAVSLEQEKEPPPDGGL